MLLLTTTFPAAVLSVIALLPSLAASATPLFRHHLGTIRADELFTSQLQPALFNWTFGQPEQFSYRAALAGRPDLPGWMRYMHSDEYASGYLYGTPPERLIGQEVHIDVLSLDALSYETRHVVLTWKVEARPAEPSSIGGEALGRQPKQVVQMRIDNLNWVQFMDPGRVENLKNIFRLELWPESAADLHVAFMDSAVSMGGRVPLRPQEKEGVIIHLASTAPLSARLHELQEEIRPLYKLTTCSYKRTSVQTIIDTAGFKIDWCTFRIQDALGERAANEAKVEAHKPASPFHQHHFVDGAGTAEPYVPMRRADAPQRNYIDEMALAVCVPLMVFTFMVAMLTMIVCLYHDKIEFPTYATASAASSSHQGAVQMVHYAEGNSIHAATLQRNAPQHPPLHLLSASAAAGSDSAEDGNSLRSCASPCASLTRANNPHQALIGEATANSPRGVGGAKLNCNSTLRPRPPPYKPPSMANLGLFQAAVQAQSAAANNEAAAVAAVMSQSASSRILYC